MSLLKERPWHRRFLVNFMKFPRTTFLQNTSGPLLLDIFIKLKHSISHSQSSEFMTTFYQKLDKKARLHE